MCLFVITFGTIGYMLIEGYTFIDGLYMSIITITTVGYGEINPLSPAGRGFTTILILLGFISLALAGRAVAESFVEAIWSDKARIKKMKKEITKLKSHYIICGFGRVGAPAVDYFIKADADFVIIESDQVICEKLQKNNLLYIEGDPTDENALIDAGIKTASGLLALLNSDPENLFVVLTARELNPTLQIISRAEDISSEKKISSAGADSVISPFTTAGKQIAINLMTATGRSSPNQENVFSFSHEPQWISLADSPQLDGKSITYIKKITGHNIIGLRRGALDHIFPDNKIKLKKTDKILVLDNTENKKNKAQELPHKFKKIVIVDDNPVILRVFSRLFQKAGFHPITAKDGLEGLNQIIKAKPDAAVIDFMLPKISGIELCSEIRKTDSCNDVKLILFTTDKQPETKKRAIRAGADAVVTKSPDASEIIKSVINVLGTQSTPKQIIKKKDTWQNNELLMKSADQSTKTAFSNEKSINLKKTLETFDGDNELLDDCLNEYLDTFHSMLQNIQQAIYNVDASELDKTAHRFKGSLIYLAAKPAADIAYQLESMGKKNNFNFAESTFMELTSECKNIKTSIYQYLSQKSVE